MSKGSVFTLERSLCQITTIENRQFYTIPRAVSKVSVEIIALVDDKRKLRSVGLVDESQIIVYVQSSFTGYQ